MSSTLTHFRSNHNDHDLNGRVSYLYEIHTERVVNGNITLSILNFEQAEPIQNEIDVSIKSGQAMITDALQQMISSLDKGIRPSMEISRNQLSEFQDQDLFWIKAALTEQME